MLQELAFESTVLGEISLRSRHDPVLAEDVYEVKLNDEYLMSSAFTAGEIALADLAQGTHRLVLTRSLARRRVFSSNVCQMHRACLWPDCWLERVSKPLSPLGRGWVRGESVGKRPPPRPSPGGRGRF